MPAKSEAYQWPNWAFLDSASARSRFSSKMAANNASSAKRPEDDDDAWTMALDPAERSSWDT